MQSREFVSMVRKILDSEAAVRERAADEVADQLNSYSPAQVSTLATLLSSIASLEADHSTLEAELHAIIGLTSTGHVALDHVEQLREIQLAKVSPQLQEYVIDLLDG